MLAVATAPAFAAHAFEKVSFPGRGSSVAALDGYLARPSEPGPFPAVVLMHGCGGLLTKSGRVQTNLAAWARRLADWGYVALAVDGFTPRGIREICTLKKRPISEFDDRPHDAYAALAYLRTLPYVDGGRIALAGWSNGAMAALSAVAAHTRERFKPPSPGFKAAFAFYPGCNQLHRKGFRPTVPTHLLVGGADDWTRPQPCLDMAAAARADGAEIAIESYPGAYHGFDHPSAAVRTRKVRNPGWKEDSREIHIGSDPAAREAAIVAVRGFLARHLGAMAGTAPR